MYTCSSNSSFQNHGHYYGVGPTFAAITAFTLLGRLSTWGWNIGSKSLQNLATRTLVRSALILGAIRPGSQSAFQFIPKVFDGVEARARCRPVKLSHVKSTNHFCMDLALCTGAVSCWKRKGPFPNCCHKVGSTELSRMSLYAAALRSPFRGKGPCPNHYSSSAKLYSWHYALGQVAISWLPLNPDLSVGLPDGEAWFITP